MNSKKGQCHDLSLRFNGTVVGLSFRIAIHQPRFACATLYFYCLPLPSQSLFSSKLSRRVFGSIPPSFVSRCSNAISRPTKTTGLSKSWKKNPMCQDVYRYPLVLVISTRERKKKRTELLGFGNYLDAMIARKIGVSNSPLRDRVFRDLMDWNLPRYSLLCLFSIIFISKKVICYLLFDYLVFMIMI